MTPSSQSHFSCDLVEQSKQHVKFLKTLHLNSISFQKPSQETFRRYSDLWLPLVHRHSLTKSSDEATTGGLIPPADIAWLWHCHRLAPYRYAKHVQKTFFPEDDSRRESKESSSTAGREDLIVLDPEYPFVLQLEDEDETKSQNFTFDVTQHKVSAEYTKKLWQQMYPSESFFLFENKNGEPDPTGNNHADSSLSGFDVIESCQRQAAFLWQVSQGSFHNDTFLAQGVENYYKFMSLMKRGEDRPRFLVPTYQIDLMWHTHILSSIKNYHKDCTNVINT